MNENVDSMMIRLVGLALAVLMMAGIIVDFHTADFLRPFFICGICSIALVADQKCTAAFHNTVHFSKTLFQSWPEVDCLKR